MNQALAAAHPTAPGARWRLGLCLEEASRHLEAFVEIWHARAVECARTRRDEIQGLTSWATTLRSLHRCDEALELVDRAVAVDPSRTTNRIAYIVRIALLADRHDGRAASREATALLEEHPRDAAVLSVAGRAFMAMARTSGESAYRGHANRCFARAKRLPPAREPPRSR